MPEISRFYGIVIKMYYNDHAPPHFHAEYADQTILVNIQTLAVIEGRLHARATGMVIEWASAHQEELMQNWQLARELAELRKIDPLR